MLESLTDEELIIFLKVREGEDLTESEQKTALEAINRESPLFFYDEAMRILGR